MTKAEMVLEADKLDIANKDDLFDDILAGRLDEMAFTQLKEKISIQKEII